MKMLKWKCCYYPCMGLATTKDREEMTCELCGHPMEKWWEKEVEDEN